MRSLVLFFIKIYQKILTLFLGYGSCRYYPTCSQYAKENFLFNNTFQALYLSIIRILKCNQLFDGCFDYPTTKIDLKSIKHSKTPKDITYWFVPKKDSDTFYIVKKISTKAV